MDLLSLVERILCPFWRRVKVSAMSWVVVVLVLVLLTSRVRVVGVWCKAKWTTSPVDLNDGVHNQTLALLAALRCACRSAPLGAAETEAPPILSGGGEFFTRINEKMKRALLLMSLSSRRG